MSTALSRESRPPFPRVGLYALIDTATLARHRIDPIEFAAAVLAASPSIIQLRSKNLGARDTLALLRRIAPLARERGVLCFANDRPDLAVLSGCDGVHLGQEDLPIAAVRTGFPDLLCGISTHDEHQLDDAIAASADYVAFGPIFATDSKTDASPVVGEALLERARARVPGPLVAIGGLTLERARRIGSLSLLGAVIGALVPESRSLPEVTSRAAALHAALGGSP